MFEVRTQAAGYCTFQLFEIRIAVLIETKHYFFKFLGCPALDILQKKNKILS